jgi:nitrite reductase/ring-hydroxylating ferredoxin subunit
MNHPDPADERLSVGPDGRAWDVQPKWRRDFPIDWPRDEYVARRDFTKFLVLVSLGFAAGQAWILAHRVWRVWRGDTGRLPMQAVARLDEIPVGSARPFRYPGTDSHAILVRLAADRLVAYDRACTHLLCPVIAEPERGRLHCPCHNGNFDIETGRPTSGPPERPLTRIHLEVRDGVVYATGREVRTA